MMYLSHGFLFSLPMELAHFHRAWDLTAEDQRMVKKFNIEADQAEETRMAKQNQE